MRAAPPVTAARLTHVRLVAAGLLLLVTSSVTALGVTLVMPILASVKLPALELTGRALLAVLRFRIGMIPVLAAAPPPASSIISRPAGR